VSLMRLIFVGGEANGCSESLFVRM